MNAAYLVSRIWRLSYSQDFPPLGWRNRFSRHRSWLARQLLGWRANYPQLLDSALVKAASRLPADRRPAEEAALRAALDDATRLLDGLDARIASEFPAYAEISNPKPLPAEEARALLASDEAMLVYLAANEGTWLWVLRHDDLALYRIEIAAKALAGEVMALRERLDPDFNSDLAPFPAARAYALYQKIVGPAEPLLAGVRHLLIVPDGGLQSLPMTVLVTKPSKQDPESSEDHRAIAWLARDYAVTVLPSCVKVTLAPAVSSSAATRWPRSPTRSQNVTLAPSARKRLTVASPIPDAPPVTAATLPSSLPMFATFHCIAKRSSTIRRIHPGLG
jgi:CHAT domain-containing protein